MYDAISDFIVYLEESIRRSEDAEEITRLEYVLETARKMLDRVAETASSVGVPS